jgi:hypothetical protein
LGTLERKHLGQFSGETMRKVNNLAGYEEHHTAVVFAFVEVLRALN